MLTNIKLSTPPARYLVPPGARRQRTLRTLLKALHWAGYIIRPAPATRTQVASAGMTPQDPLAEDSTTASARAVTRLRQAFTLTHADFQRASVTLCVDRVIVDAPGLGPFVEIHAHLKQGPAELLDDVQTILASQPDLLIARLDDEQRASFAGNDTDARNRAPPGSHLAPESRWLDLGVAHLKALQVQLAYCEPQAWESLTPEGVHQMRVATRRSREALRVFGASLPGAWSGPLLQDLRWIGAVLGRVRDFDVQLERLANYRKVVSAAGQSALRRYRRYLLKGRHRAHRQLVDALASERYQKLVSDYRSLVVAALASGGCEPGDPAISATIGAMVPVALAPPLQALLKQGNRTANRRTREHLHKVRIASKRLRYLLEYLQPVDGVTGTDGIGALTRLQDTLGEYQDACSARERLRVYRRDIAGDKQDRKHIRRLMTFEERRAARAESLFRHDWKTFNGVCNSLVLC